MYRALLVVACGLLLVPPSHGRSHAPMQATALEGLAELVTSGGYGSPGSVAISGDTIAAALGAL